MGEVSIGLSAREMKSPSETESFVEGEYKRCLKSLNKTGILSILSESESLGVIGIDGKEYPMPTPEQIGELFEHHKDLIAKKREQGFGRLQMTPLAMPISLLSDRVGKAITKHAKDRKIFQTKRNPNDPDGPVLVIRNEPMQMWQDITGCEEDDDLVYFPQAYLSGKHKGSVKADVLKRRDICAVPGWSISLIEDAPFQPRPGEGKKIGGRQQLEIEKSPIEYLQALRHADYQGETGWTPEDFLTNFVTRLEETNQVSNDWDDDNAVWLTGTYLPQERSVPMGRWDRRCEELLVRVGHPEFGSFGMGVRSAVRLAAPR